jgi:hypothetical protein
MRLINFEGDATWYPVFTKIVFSTSAQHCAITLVPFLPNWDGW